MALNKLNLIYPLFNDLRGNPLDGGKIFIGEAGKNAEINPISIYWDEALTIPAGQTDGLPTISGYIVNNGTPANIFMNSDFSITAKDKNNVIIFVELNNTNELVKEPSVVDTVANLSGIDTNFSKTAIVKEDGLVYSFETPNWVCKDWKTVSTVAELIALDILTYSKAILTEDGRSGRFVYTATAGADDGGVTLSKWVRQYDGNIKTTWFGAVEDGVTDDLTAIQAAIDYANSLDGISVVEGNGGVSLVSGMVDVKNEVVYANSSLLYSAVGGNIAIVNMGDANGDTLIRPAGIENVHVEVTSTTTGLVGFRINNYVRSSWIKNCTAKMLGAADASNFHIGFEIVANRIAVTTNAGTYQNVIDTCTAFFASTGFRIRTAGTTLEAEGDPQANGNYLKNCFVYSGRQKALDLSYGAQENICEVRADTFVDQIALGTTIQVANVDGRYNKVHLIEEIGARGDTQYSVRIGGTAIYNEIEYSTQNVVTAKVDESSTVQGRRAKNIIRQIGSGLISNGRPGSEAIVNHYFTLAAAQTQSLQEIWIAPAKCVITKVQGRLNATAPTGGDTRLYFAKEAGYSTSNRVTWAASEASTLKSITTDVSASVDINTNWTLEEGDRIFISGDTPSGGGASFSASLYVKFV